MPDTHPFKLQSYENMTDLVVFDQLADIKKLTTEKLYPS